METQLPHLEGRLPQELRRAQIQTVAQANQSLRQSYITEFNQQFAVPASQPGTTFVPCRRRDLDWVFSLQHERTVNQDNTVVVERRVFQIQKTRWRHSLAGCVVMVHEHLDGRVSIRYGPHVIGFWQADQLPPQAPKPTRPARLPVAKPQPTGRPGFASPSTRQGSLRLAPFGLDGNRTVWRWAQLAAGAIVDIFKNRTLHLLPKPDIFIC